MDSWQGSLDHQNFYYRPQSPDLGNHLYPHQDDLLSTDDAVPDLDYGSMPSISSDSSTGSAYSSLEGRGYHGASSSSTYRPLQESDLGDDKDYAEIGAAFRDVNLDQTFITSLPVVDEQRDVFLPYAAYVPPKTEGRGEGGGSRKNYGARKSGWRQSNTRKSGQVASLFAAAENKAQQKTWTEHKRQWEKRKLGPRPATCTDVVKAIANIRYSERINERICSGGSNSSHKRRK